MSTTDVHEDRPPLDEKDDTQLVPRRRLARKTPAQERMGGRGRPCPTRRKWLFLRGPTIGVWDNRHFPPVGVG